MTFSRADHIEIVQPIFASSFARRKISLTILAGRDLLAFEHISIEPVWTEISFFAGAHCIDSASLHRIQ